MNLVTIPVFLTHFDPRSRPDERTVRRWIDNREVTGRRIGRQYWVDLDDFRGQLLPGDSADDLVKSVLGGVG